ncbi:hypothetical protein F3Y22_tig00116997pilonHSYRG00993 [Hibiscus syriacus]|uniref:Uncharacterized protein n=1 Tax=Hibiscus syriacus TaxID=106335 RepID=A0A6A2XT27_HIBSY|nr:hypothetical protein F3Y22_tig00116997pilonHSYRG00993 [Hibiscus syriacus]
MSGAKFEVAKFDGLANFRLWQTRVNDLLAQQGILKALRPIKPASMEEEDWEELQQRATGTIRLCLADEVMYHVMHLSSPNEIWRKLESQFMSKSLTTKLYLKQRLYGLKIQDDHDLAQHVNVFNQIISDLARLDVKIEDEDRAMILLCSLPPSYEHMVTTLTYGKETINVEEITAALLAYNQRKQNAGENSQADSLYVKGNRDRGRKPEKAGSGKRNSRSKSRDKKTIHCYKCKEAGHMKRDCLNEGDMLFISTTQLTDAWILDSGCSYHITPNREWFSTYRSVNSGFVYLGDDRCCNIVGIGDVRIKMYDGSVRTLSGVRHIPDLKKNLISLGTLHKNGFIPKTDEDSETIRIVEFIQLSPVMILQNCGICVLLILVNVTKVRFKTVKHTTQGILDYMHFDVWGPSTISSLGGSRHYVTFIDDFSRKVWVYFLKQKSKVFEKFKLWKGEVENQTGQKIKCLRSDNGTEYTDSQFLHFCKEHGIKRHFTVRKTPQQNGVAERMNRSLNERARCLRLNAGLPKHFWAKAVNMACYLINRSPRASLAGKVAEEVWTGHDVSFDNLRIFGCPAYVHVPADERSKLDAKSKECIFLGYKKGVKGFKFWDPVAKKIVISRDVVFDEQSMLQQKKDTTVVDFEQFPFEKPETSQPTSGGSTTDDLQDYSLARDRVRRTNIKPPSILCFEDLVSFALIVSSDDPVTFHDAITSQENDKWMTAMVEEMEALNHNQTNSNRKKGEKFKARLVAKGFSQQKGVDYDEIFSPVVRHTSIRAVLALVASWDSHLEHMDVKTAFFHGDLEDQIYMRQPEGFTQPGNEHLVCRLKKSLYGLKQSPRQWYKRFDSYMIKIGYNRCEYDCCVYVKSLDYGSFIFLLLYVDDMLIAAKNMDDVIGLKTLLSQEFDMKDLGAVKKILGMEICRDRDSRKLWLSQWGYVKKMLERFAMSSAKPVSTPLANHFKLSSEQCAKTDKEAEDMAKVSYSNVVGCLMYAMVCTRPDLGYVVSQVCKYMSKHGKQHWEAVKWIFRYLKGTVGHRIVFGSQRDNPLVVGYVDSDYAGDLDNRRSTIGYVFTLGGRPICWKSTVQSVVALSTTEAEYMVAAEAAKEALWLTGLVKELGVQLLYDNQSAIHLAKNQVYRVRTKHIDVRFYKIRELVASGEILFQKVHTDENAADMFTKPVTTDKFKHCLDLLNVSSMAHKYTGKEDMGWSGVSEANINCPYKESLVEGVTIIWVGGTGGAPPQYGTEDVSTGSGITNEFKQQPSTTRGGRAGGRGRARLQCQLCGKIGHSVDRCWYRFDRDFVGILANNARSQYKEDSSNINYVNLDSVACTCCANKSGVSSVATQGAATSSTNAKSSRTQWIVDSGATHHVTPDASHITHPTDLDGPGNIVVGNGSSLNVQSVGRSVLRSSSQTLLLTDLLHVPKITKHLLSVSKLARDNHIFFEFHADTCCVRDEATCNILLRGRQKGGLYTFTLDSQLNACNNAKAYAVHTHCNSFELWHRRLGHPAFSTLKLVCNSIAIDIPSNANQLCVACCLGKSHKLPFVDSTTVYDEPFQLVFTYLWGPSPAPSAGFRLFKSMVETQFSLSIKAVQSDWGGEYRNWTAELTHTGILHRVTCPHSSEQNGVVECKHRHLIELALVLLAQASLPIKFWSYAVTTTAYLINRLPSKVLNNISPFEKLFHKKPDYTTMCVFGCRCFPHLREFQPHKLMPRSQECTFLGYSSQHKAAKQDDAHHMVSSLRSASLEVVPPRHSACSTTVAPILEHPAQPPVEDDSVPDQVPLLNTHPMVTRSKHGIFKPKFMMNLMPYTEMEHEPRLVAKRFLQVPGHEFKETFSPVVKFPTLNVILSIAVSNKWPLRHVDVNNAFLHGDLTEEVFMQQPPGFEQFDEDGTRLVCKLHKALYGLRQAPRNWNNKLKDNLLQMGFHVSRADVSLFVSLTEEEINYILVYVDDIVITGQSVAAIERVCSPHGLMLSQKKFISELLEKSNMTKATSTSTPMVISNKLQRDAGKLIEDAREFRSMVGALLYACHTRPDIVYSVSKVAQFMHEPRESHLQAAKRILRYLAGTTEYGLLFKPSKETLRVVAFADTDWGGCIDDRRSMSGRCVLFGGNLVSWSTKKHKVVSISTMEAEYRSLADAVAEVTWIDALLNDIGVTQQEKPIIWCDNTSAISLSVNPIHHAQSKHVDLDVHFVREKVAGNQLYVSYVPAAH